MTNVSIYRENVMGFRWAWAHLLVGLGLGPFLGGLGLLLGWLGLGLELTYLMGSDPLFLWPNFYIWGLIGLGMRRINYLNSIEL